MTSPHAARQNESVQQAAERIYKEEISGYLDSACDDEDITRIVKAITTALAEAKREVWEEAAHILEHPEYTLQRQDCIREFRRRSRAP